MDDSRRITSAPMLHSSHMLPCGSQGQSLGARDRGVFVNVCPRRAAVRRRDLTRRPELTNTKPFGSRVVILEYRPKQRPELPPTPVGPQPGCESAKRRSASGGEASQLPVPSRLPGPVSDLRLRDKGLAALRRQHGLNMVIDHFDCSLEGGSFANVVVARSSLMQKAAAGHRRSLPNPEISLRIPGDFSTDSGGSVTGCHTG